MVFGGALAYTYSHVHWSRKQGHADNESAYLAPYVSFDNGDFYSGAAIQGTLNFYHVKRKMIFPGYENKAKNYHRSFDLLTKVLIGGKIHAAELLRFQPEAQLDYVNVYEEKYKETKAGSVSLKVKSKHSAYLRGTFTMKGVVEKEFENSCFNASFKTGFFVTNPLYSADYTSAFKDSPGCASNFTVSSYKDTMVQAVLGAGLSFMKSCMGGSVNYEGSFGYGGDPNANELTLSGFWEF
jgi:outer membrane autotransporter protein